MTKTNKYECITIGVSAGGTKALERLLPVLPRDFPFSIVIIQHLHPQQEGYFIQYFDSICNLKVKEADEKEIPKAGTIYFAPANYHLLLEEDNTFALNVDPKVNYARPSIDIFFDCAAAVYKEKLIGIILTGANSDGAKGLQNIIEQHGTAIIQDPADAEIPSMPKAAIKLCNAHYILNLEKIAELLIDFSNEINKLENET